MTQEILCTGTTQHIASLIKECQFPADAFLLVEKLPQQVVSDDERQDLLCFARLGDAAIDIASYTSGRVFTTTFELRWERDTTATRVVYLGEPRELPGLRMHPDTFESVGEPKRYYLFGTRLDPRDLDRMGIERDEQGATYYAEVRIPRLLSYPIATQARRVQLVVGEYHSREKGQLFRFRDVIPAKEDGEEA